MSPVEVRQMSWVYFLDLLNYKNEYLEKEANAATEYERKLNGNNRPNYPTYKGRSK